MATTFELIQAANVGAGGQASVDFTVIPSTFTDLCIKLSARNTTSGSNFWVAVSMNLNNSSANFSFRDLVGAPGIGVFSGSGSNSNFTWITDNIATASTFGNAEIYIPNYAGSNNKSMSVDMVTERNGTEALLQFSAALWSNTSAINRITLTPASGSFAQHTNIYLYGVKNA